MRVIISENNKKLKKYLESHRKIHYIYFGEKEDEIVDFLDKCGGKEILMGNYKDNSFKNKFVRSYLDLVGELGAKYNSIYWWITFTSSKNKFMSRLLPNLLSFLSIIEILREEREEDILIINPPKSIINSISKYCLRNSIYLEKFPNYLSDTVEVSKGFLSRHFNLLVFIFKTWGKIYISNKLFKHRFACEVNKTERYYVLRSWFYERSLNANNEYQDSFFGTLPRHIEKHNKLIIVGGIIGDYLSIAKKIAKNNDYLIIPQEYFLNYSDPIKAAINVSKNEIKVKEDIEFMGLDVKDIIEAEISKDYAQSAKAEYLHSYYVKRMLNLFDINTFTTTYENNPWEKVCFITLKEYSPNTKIIGYQHSVLSKSSLNMFLSEYEIDVIPMPDKIITVGKVTKTILEEYGNYNPSKIHEGCGLRFKYLFDVNEKERIKNYNILITPEGVLSESVNLVNFVFDSLKNYQGLNLIIRPHPALPFELFKNNLKFDVESCPNFTISKNDSVKKDLDISDIVIYRGSSLSIEALKTGLPVIYVDLNDLLSVDPLFDCDALKWTVRTNKELFDAVKGIYDLPDDEYKIKMTKANKYINSYMYNITNERLSEFIVSSDKTYSVTNTD